MSAVKDKLKQVEHEIGKLREERAEAAKARDEARAAFAGSESLKQDSPEFVAAQDAVRDLGEIDDKIAELQAVQIGALKMMGGDESAPAAADRGGRMSEDAGWDSSRLFASAELRAKLERHADSKVQMGPVRLGEVISREAFAADVTGSTVSRRGDWLGILPQLRRRLSVLDLIPVGQMNGNSFPYTREAGSFATATEVTEGSSKPEAALTFSDVDAPAVTIAHWLKARKQVMADIPALLSVIDSRLRYGVERRLEAEILAGDGNAPNLLGILNTAGIGTVAYDGAELIADQILAGITTVLLADAQATGIVMHPSDWQTVVKSKAADGHYYSKGPHDASPAVLWGLPVIPSAALSAGHVLVGDFEIGAQLMIRQGVEVVMSDSDQDDFIKNKVTVLAEMRAALPVYRPAAFCDVDIAA